jgi:hypothetical protein
VSGRRGQLDTVTLHDHPTKHVNADHLVKATPAAKPAGIDKLVY